MPRPLGVHWRAHVLPQFRAGAATAARVELANEGTTPWHGERFTLSYHWLDDRGNAIVWDGIRTPVTAEPGETVQVEMAVRAPIPPGRYRLSIDVVDEGRFWFAELGERRLDADVDVGPRVEGRDETEARFGAAQPADDWHDRVLEAHREGYAVVGGSVDARRRDAALAPYIPGVGRVPNFEYPLVCPSVVREIKVQWMEIGGLPAVVAPADEPTLYDGRIRVRLPSDRPRG